MSKIQKILSAALLVAVVAVYFNWPGRYEYLVWPRNIIRIDHFTGEVEVYDKKAGWVLESQANQ